MKFVEELQQSETKKTVADAIAFAQQIKPRLIESAEKGYGGFDVALEGREDAHILRKDLFIQTVKENLDGCTVRLRKDEHTHILTKAKYYREYIDIHWR